MSAAEIIDAIGRESATRLSRKLGGKFVYVPQEPTEDNPIAQALDFDTFKALAEAIGSGVLYIPVGIYKSQRDRRISELLARGATAKRVARALHISERTVRHVSRFDRATLQKQRQADGRQRDHRPITQ